MPDGGFFGFALRRRLSFSANRGLSRRTEAARWQGRAQVPVLVRTGLAGQRQQRDLFCGARDAERFCWGSSYDEADSLPDPPQVPRGGPAPRPRFADPLDADEYADHADAAWQNGYIRARITQIMTTAFDRTEETGREPITERDLRRVLEHPLWAEQRRVWGRYASPNREPTSLGTSDFNRLLTTESEGDRLTASVASLRPATSCAWRSARRICLWLPNHGYLLRKLPHTLG